MGKFLISVTILSFSAMVFGGQVDNKQKQINVSVTQKGFEPNSISVNRGMAVVLNVTRKTEDTCSKEILVPSLKLKKTLPLNQTVQVDLGVLPEGEIKFGCGMNLMDSGVIFIK